MTRAPEAPGLSTSITQPSTTVGRVKDGAIGAATASLRALATASPPSTMATINNGKVTALGAPITRAAPQPDSAKTAAKAHGHSGGSLGKAK